MSRDLQLLREPKDTKTDDYGAAAPETLRQQQAPFEPDPNQVFKYGDEIELIRNPDYARNFPYLVVYTDATVIPNHNQIYSEPFSNFVRRFYIRHIRNQQTFVRDCWTMPFCSASDIEPCERSCRRADGASCSERGAPTPDGEG